MIVQTVRGFSTKERGEVRRIEKGTVLDLDDFRAKRLLEAGVAVPASHSDQEEGERDSRIQWKTKTGRVLYLITSERIRRTAPEGKAVFSLDELEQMRGLPDEQVEAIITSKEVFPGAVVEG